MHFEAGGFARLAEPVAHLLVLGPQRQPPHAAFRRGAEFRGFVNRVPQPGGVDLQIGCDLGHELLVQDVHSVLMTRPPRRVNNGRFGDCSAALCNFGGEIGDALDRQRVR